MNRCTEVLEEEVGAVGSEPGRGKGEGEAGAGDLPPPLCHVLPAALPLASFIPGFFL